ncbi:SHOCT domain-containing protein [Dyadobacter alkalitolerans]|uniref:SHOCT domain-containing protein n=1 Tax=Dyadobacter alkalitolerans TaxID=492736 RepID=UPI0003F602F4|nr:SHOCT domain-containing protein [Dyadobacter alkalitolerans]
MDIENAIATCEIENCKGESSVHAKSDKYDQLKKLKDLHDKGILSEDEYSAEKKKLLDQK